MYQEALIVFGVGALALHLNSFFGEKAIVATPL